MSLSWDRTSECKFTVLKLWKIDIGPTVKRKGSTDRTLKDSLWCKYFKFQMYIVCINYILFGLELTDKRMIL